MLDLTPMVIGTLKAENLAPTLKGGFSNFELRSDPLKISRIRDGATPKVYRLKLLRLAQITMAGY